MHATIIIFVIQIYSSSAEPECVSIMDAIKAVAETGKFEEYLALNDSIVHLILHCDGKGFQVQDQEKLKKVKSTYVHALHDTNNYVYDLINRPRNC